MGLVETGLRSMRDAMGKGTKTMNIIGLPEWHSMLMYRMWRSAMWKPERWMIRGTFFILLFFFSSMFSIRFDLSTVILGKFRLSRRGRGCLIIT